jgi:DNA-binding CsgD family transcriptional regulator
VDLAGKIVEHDLGYRAERMRIAELLAFGGTEETVGRFARRIGVPLGEPMPDPAGVTIASCGLVPGSAKSGGCDEHDPIRGLTLREIEVLRLLASGMTFKELSKRLHVGNATLRSVLGHIRETGDRARPIVRLLQQTRQTAPIGLRPLVQAASQTRRWFRPMSTR